MPNIPAYGELVQRIKALEKEITDHRGGEGYFNHSNRMMVDILESISDGFFTLDDNLVVNYFNKMLIIKLKFKCLKIN